MNRRTVFAMSLCGALLTAATAFVPTAQAGNVAWGVSVGGPGFGVSAGQPAYYGGRGYYRAPYYPVARTLFRPYYRPYFHSGWRPVIVVPQVRYIAPPVTYPYYTPPPY